MGIKASASVTVAQVTDGADGNGIKSTVVEYQAGSSGTTAPTGSWSTSIPATTASAPYLWTKVTYTYTDGSAPKVVYSVGSTPEGAIESSKAYTDAQFEIVDGKIISTASEVTSLGTRMSTVEQSAEKIDFLITTETGTTNFTLTDAGATLLSENLTITDGDGSTVITGGVMNINQIFANDITATGTIRGVKLVGATGTFKGDIEAKNAVIHDSLVMYNSGYTTDYNMMSVVLNVTTGDNYKNDIAFGVYNEYYDSDGTLLYSGTSINQLTIWVRNMTLLCGNFNIKAITQVEGTLTIGSDKTDAGIEIFHNTPYIDFHFGRNDGIDYTSRIIEGSSGTLSINGVECSGGSLTATHVTSTAEAYFNGPAYFANGQWNHLGDDVLFGDQNFAGGFCIYGVTGAPQIVFVNNGAGIASLNTQSLRFAPGGEEYGWAILGVTDRMWGFYPNYNSHSLNLGTSGHKWVNVYAKNGTIQTSDEREKDILGVIDERYFAFFERIDPIKYRWRDDEKDTRVRLGIGAQTAEKALIESGLSLEEYAGISHYYFDEPLSNGLYDSYSMDYTMYTIIAAAQTKKNMYSIREIEKYQEEQKQSVKSSQRQIDQLREELSQTRIDYVELKNKLEKLEKKLESVA